MKISSLIINNVGGITNLTLNQLDPHLNIICGENGIGKTNIIESITACFTEYCNNYLKKKANSEKGIIELSIINENNDIETIKYTVENFSPRENSERNYHLTKFLEINSKSLLYFKVDRFSLINGLTHYKYKKIKINI